MISKYPAPPLHTVNDRSRSLSVFRMREGQTQTRILLRQKMQKMTKKTEKKDNMKDESERKQKESNDMMRLEDKNETEERTPTT